MIVVRLTGGLGNQMFQYALGRVLSIKYNTELVLNTEMYLDAGPGLFGATAVRGFQLDVFTIAGRVAKKSEIPWIRRMYFKGRLMLLIEAVRKRIFRHTAQEIHFKKFNPQLLELGPDAYLDGLFQSPKYFSGYEETMRKDFAFKNTFSKEIKVLSEEISRTNSVCVHVRRTDFVGSKYHEVVSLEYYKRGIEYLSGKASIDAIYVFSDDVAWCKANLQFDSPTVFVGEEYAGDRDSGHFFLMSICHHFIIPNSTYSWWAAWLSSYEDKKVVAPKQWFGDPAIDTSDLLPESWIRI